MKVDHSLLLYRLRGQSLFSSNFICLVWPTVSWFIRLECSKILTVHYLFLPQTIVLRGCSTDWSRRPSCGGCAGQLVHPSAARTLNHLYLCSELGRPQQLERVWMRGRKNSIACISAFFGLGYRREHHLNLSFPAQLQIFVRNAPKRSKEWQRSDPSQEASRFEIQDSQALPWWCQNCTNFL